MSTRARVALSLLGIWGCAAPSPPIATIAVEPAAPIALATAAPEPEPPREEPAEPAPAMAEPESPPPVVEVAPSPDDPLQGVWTMADAVKGLPAGTKIIATIVTDYGALECRLYDDKAPVTVANFIGLARGTRPWKTPAGTWERRPTYAGSVFHRVIRGFMIQGGDPKKDGTGEAGFMFRDEIWQGAKHDRPGLLCAANRGPNTNSAQFFITDAAAPHLDKGHTIFGECGPVALVHTLASVPVGPRDKPIKPLVIRQVKITRR